MMNHIEFNKTNILADDEIEQTCDLCHKNFNCKTCCNVKIDTIKANAISVDWDVYILCPECETKLKEFIKKNTVED